MKTNNIFKTFVAVAASLLICAVACDEPNPLETTTPEFPDLVENYNVAPGDTLELSFTPNMDWEVTVPEDTMDFFWLIDESFQYSKISGKASEEAVTVKIGVSAKVDFVNRTTTVKLTMGGETHIIAKYMRPAAGKSVQLYVCQVDENGAWVFEEGGNYAYSENEPDTLKLVYTGSDFRIPVKVVSNLEYEMELPSWARADIPEVKTGVTTFNIYGIPTKYPLDDKCEKLILKNGGEIVKEYVIMIPGCRNIIRYGVDMVSELNFSSDGKYLSAIDFMEGPVKAWIEGAADATVVAVEMVDDKYDVTAATAPSWLKITVGKYSNSITADVLQKRDVEISVKTLAEGERAAVLFFLASPVKDLSTLFDADAVSVKEEYVSSVVYVTQKVYGYLTLLNENDFMLAKGTLVESEDASLYTKFGNVEYAYEMTYKDQWASDKGQLLFKEKYASYKIFNKLGVEVTENLFLAFNEDRNCVEMGGEIRDEGYVVFYDVDDNAVAVVKCIYEPMVKTKDYEEDQIRDASMYFTDPEAAKTSGAKMEEIWAGPTFYADEDAFNAGAVLLRLTCKYDTPIEIDVPIGAKLIGGYPNYSFDLGGLDLSNVLTPVGNRKSIVVKFTKPRSDWTNIQKITFSGTNSSGESVVILIIYCCGLE